MGDIAVPFNEIEMVNLLLTDANARGYTTYDHILKAVPEIENNLTLLDRIIEELQAKEVTIYESEEDAKAKSAAVPASTTDTKEKDLTVGDEIELNGVKIEVVDATKLAEIEEEKIKMKKGSHHAAPLFDLSTVPIDDSVGLYFREMGQQNLLSAAEEVELAKKIEAGREFELDEIDEETLGWDERDERARVLAMGDAARAHLIRANTRLVVSIAKKYRGRGLQFLDLIQEGNVGLMKAVEKYDYRRGNRFSTYATWWIRQAVTRALANHGRTIRIPAHLGGRISKLYQVAQELEQKLGRQPSPEEIAEHMEIPADRVRWMLRTSRQPVHLERPVGDESDAELGDFIEDVDAPAPQEAVAQNMLTEEISEILDQLTPREARILRLRYGLQDGESRTLKEVGEMFGLSRERIRQLEKEALRKLRHPSFAGHLRQYLS